MIIDIINKAEQEYPHPHETGVMGGVVENAVYTTGEQTIDGTKTFSETIVGNINGNAATVTNGVYTTGDQTINDLKDFTTTPTVNTIPVMVSGDPTDLIHLYGKSIEAGTIYKGQPVYISSAQGSHPLLSLASNAAEATSSKTIGVLAQDLNLNDFGYVVTEGVIEGIDGAPFGGGALGAEGDPIWLGPTGSLIFGASNAPVAPAHHVYLGVVLRSQNNNNSFYIAVQNGAEMDELHNVAAVNPSNKDALLYNSTSGLWISRQITTGDVSGSENFVTTNTNQTINGDKTFEAESYIFSGADVTIAYSSTFTVDTANTTTNGIVKNFGGASGMEVMTSGEYDLITPVSGVVYILTP